MRDTSGTRLAMAVIGPFFWKEAFKFSMKETGAQSEARARTSLMRAPVKPAFEKCK
ncbi:hypothetical protein BSFA1_70890 (plasmid) [Burkholderia sp. SFA1]|nr:hypothetical protein BSFA1_70890 [Burkholderia sp. SFA1]